MARILTVYSPERRATRMIDMSYIRWQKISEALARRGHQVDIATAELRLRLGKGASQLAPNLRKVPLSRVRWSEYDVVKTLFHLGFETLERYGGGEHPFIVSKLGSVVGPTDMEGIYFYGRQRAQMYEVQQRISERSRFITLLSEPARELWRQSHGGDDNLLLVPGAVDADIPPPARDPYPADGRIRCVFSGNFYVRTSRSQTKAHLTLAGKLNELGRRLTSRGRRLYVVGPGDARSLDSRYVTYCGVVPYERSWDYLHAADVGILVAAGGFMHNNESTKLYHYLRAGLPVVSEAGFPNDHVVREARLGFVVDNGDLEQMAEKTVDVAGETWDRAHAVRYILGNHTWDSRAEAYDRVIRKLIS
jgi:glycosyltransferase involved in cell wall biosynthesis